MSEIAFYAKEPHPVRNGLYRTRPRPWGPAPWTGAFLLGQAVVFVPATFSGQFLGLNWATKSTFQLLFLLAGFAALMFGYIGRMLEQSAAEDGGEGPLRSFAPRDRQAS